MTRCSSYDPFVERLFSRGTPPVRVANVPGVRWRNSLLAVARMEWMAKSADFSGSVDQDKMQW